MTKRMMAIYNTLLKFIKMRSTPARWSIKRPSSDVHIGLDKQKIELKRTLDSLNEGLPIKMTREKF